MLRALCLIALLTLSFFVHAAPKYIALEPMTRLVNTPVAPVKGNANILPMITWGGDIATVYANGRTKKTSPSSLFAQNGLNYRLEREDVFVNQVKNYISGNTPFLRGTLGMINSAADVLNKDPRTKPIVFYQMTWSAGGDALVVKNGIKNAKDLRGKTIAVQAYGPHVDYLLRVLADAELSVADIKLKWLPDLTASDNSPMAALYEKDVDAAFVIIPDALTLTSDGNIGTGTDGSIKGAKILMSTKTANRVIADVYAVRSDYYAQHQQEIQKLAKTLMVAEEKLSELIERKNARGGEYTATMEAAAQFLLDSRDAIADIEGLYADCEFVRFNGNVKFFANANYPRNFEKLNSEIRTSLATLNVVNGSNAASKVNFNYVELQKGLTNVGKDDRPRFRRSEVAALISRKQQQGSLADNELFSFEVRFAPNQNNFRADQYQREFQRVVELAATYGGALITVEGHSDPMGYLRAKKKNEQPVVLGQIKQSAKNLSVSRALSVRNAINDYTKTQNVAIDTSQFEAIGHGISQPASGVCGSDPCAPKDEKAWRSNMRVVFRLIQVEAESNVFAPL